MSTPEYVDPASCPPHKTYTGLVQTHSGLHKRVLRRVGDSLVHPWLYFGSPEEGGGNTALDSQVSELEEVDPFVNDWLWSAKSEAERLRKSLDQAENVIRTLRGATPLTLTEERVREIVLDELASVDLKVSEFVITIPLQDRAALDREDHDL